MYNFYSIYCKLCSEANISLTKASVEIGLSNAAPTGWKKGKIPNAVNMYKISTYFTEKLGRPITVSYLKGEEPEPSRQNELAGSVPTVLHDDADQGELSEDVKNMATALAIAMRQQKKPEQPPLPELEEAEDILSRLDKDKLTAALLMLRGLLGKQ